MTRAAIYVRKSTSAGLEQEFNSLDAQRESCARYAESRGWTVLSESYEDGGYTGANIDRPAFQRLLADIEQKKIDVVVVYKVDRLSRSLLDFAKVMDRFHAAGVAFVSVTQNFSTADAMGRLTLNMLMSFAEFEREMIAERTRDKIAAARRRGKWTGGVTPLGYRIDSSKLVVVEGEARVVRDLFARYLEERSLVALIKELRARGMTPRGGTWTKDSVLRILRNPVYVGQIRLGTELHSGEHIAIVARDVFDRVQTAMGRQVASAPQRNPAYVLRGLLRCGLCNAAMTTASTRKGSRTYRFYRCVTRDKQGAAACPTRPVSAESIESLVLERIRQQAPSMDRDEVQRALKKRIEAEREQVRAMRNEIPPKIASLTREIDQLFTRILDLKPAARALAEDRLEALDAERKEEEAKLEACARRESALGRDLDAQWVGRALADIDVLWERLTDVNRGKLIAALVARVVVDERRGEIAIVLVDEEEAAA